MTASISQFSVIGFGSSVGVPPERDLGHEPTLVQSQGHSGSTLTASREARLVPRQFIFKFFVFLIRSPEQTPWVAFCSELSQREEGWGVT